MISKEKKTNHKPVGIISIIGRRLSICLKKRYGKSHLENINAPLGIVFDKVSFFDWLNKRGRIDGCGILGFSEGL